MVYNGMYSLDKPLLRHLLDLQGQSLTKTARDVGVDPGNLSGWFKSDRPFSEQKRSRLESYLQIADGSLRRDRLHYFTTSRDFTALQSVLDAFFTSPELVSITLQDSEKWTLSSLKILPVAGVVDASGLCAVLILKPRLSEELKLKNQWLSPQYLAGTQWLDETGELNNACQLGMSDYSRLLTREIQLEEFQKLIHQPQSITWEQVMAFAEQHDIGPRQVYHLLQTSI